MEIYSSFVRERMFFFSSSFYKDTLGLIVAACLPAL